MMIDNLEYFKVFENKKSNTMLISIGEIHTSEKCESTGPTQSILDFLEEIYNLNSVSRLSKDRILFLLLEMQTAVKTSKDPIDLYNTAQCGLFYMCKNIKQKNVDFINIDPRRWESLSWLLSMYVFIYENKILNINDVKIKFDILSANFEQLNLQIKDFVDSVGRLNLISNASSMIVQDINNILSNLRKLKTDYDQSPVVGLSDDKIIHDLIDSLWINIQDLYTLIFIKNNHINILYTGSKHNNNIERGLLRDGWRMYNIAYNIKTNCTFVNKGMLFRRIDKYVEKIIKYGYKYDIKRPLRGPRRAVAIAGSAKRPRYSPPGQGP
jgi:hypothetical protein